MKRVLITAGTVYGPLDANKLVGNRVRGLWATQFAGYLSAKGHEVTLLLPDTMPPKSALDVGNYDSSGPARLEYALYWREDNENPALQRFFRLIEERY